MSSPCLNTASKAQHSLHTQGSCTMALHALPTLGTVRQSR